MALVRERDGKRLHVKSALMGESLVSKEFIGLEMGMLTGVIAKFGSMVSEQNALMIATLLSPWGGIKISHSDIVKLPTYFAENIIPEIGAQDLLDRDQDDLVIERPCLEIIQNSEVIEKVQIINGLVEGNITRALNGEHVGTFIYKQ